MKRLITAAMLTAAAFASAIGLTAQAADISVAINGRNVEFDESPRIINDRVMVPMRKIFEELGAEVRWDDETKTATAVKDAQYVQFQNDNIYMFYGACRDGVNSGELEYASSDILDSAPVIENGTMFVPVRAVSEAFYYDVDYSMGKVSITTPTDADGWIYYSSWTDGGHMYKIDTNGQNRQLLVAEDCYADMGFQYANGYIYYSVREPENHELEGQIYRIKPDGTGQERLTDAACYMPFNYDHDWHSDNIFYVEKSNNPKMIYDIVGAVGKIDTKTGEAVTLVEKPVEETALYQDYVYFIYAADGAIHDMTCYRVDADGNIINISGDKPVRYIAGIDSETERVRMYTGEGTTYITNLDGSEPEETKRYSYGSNAYEYGLDYLRYEGEDFVIGEKWDDEAIYGVNSDKTERFKITAPEGASIGLVEYHEGKVYYSIYGGEYDTEKIYVTGLDELLGMKRISIGEEMVDGKYVVETNRSYYVPSELDGTYVMNDDGTDNHKIVDKYVVEYIHDGMMILYDRSSIYNYDWDSVNLYMADLDGGNLRKFDEEEFYSYYDENYKDYEDKEDAEIVDIREYVMYGIVVYNDGRVEDYYHPSSRKYRGYY